MSQHKHLSPAEEKAIETFVQQLMDELESEVKDIRMFGSKARGDAGPESDLDVLVLVQDSAYALKHRILWIASEISLNFGILLSPRVVPSAAWNEVAEAETLFFRTIRAESIPLLNAA